MTHLRIEQNNIQENISGAIIEKLYESTINGDLDQSSNLAGTLYTPNTYTKYIEYLTNTFPDLVITATNYYAWFEDPEVRNVLASKIGDGTGVTTTTVQSLTVFSNSPFSGNKNIVQFDELSQFVNITTIDNTSKLYFNNCTNLKSIDLSNITRISGDRSQRWNFENCTNLEYIGNTQNLTFLGTMAFDGCSKLKSIDTSNVTVFRDRCLNWCTGLLDDIILNERVTIIGDDAFQNVKKLPDTINLPNLQTLGNGFEGTNIKHVTNLGTITEIGGVFVNYTPFYNCTQLQDVTIPETVTLIKYGGLKNCDNVRWVKILSNTVPTYSSVEGSYTTKNYGKFFGESWRNEDPTNEYTGKTYPIYVKDELLSQYQTADNWNHIGHGRLRALSQFATDFPNE